MKYRKKPVEVEAIQEDDLARIERVLSFVGKAVRHDIEKKWLDLDKHKDKKTLVIQIPRHHGLSYITDIFEKTYEKIEENENVEKK